MEKELISQQSVSYQQQIAKIPSQGQNQDHQQLLRITNNNEQHEQACECQICAKQREIQAFRKNQVKLHFLTSYKHSYNKPSKKQIKKAVHDLSEDFLKAQPIKKNKQRQKNPQNQKTEIQKEDNNYLEAILEKRKKNKEQKKKIEEKQAQQAKKKQEEKQKFTKYDNNHTDNMKHPFISLGSSYLSEYSMKKSEKVSFKPKDNLNFSKNYSPVSTTYLQSYYSTLTPKPDDSMKCFELPAGKLQFKGQSSYHKSYKDKSQSKPSEQIIQPQNLHLPKTLGPVKSTQRDSYRSLENPEKNSPIKYKNTIVNLPSFTHNYDTTYKNMFISSAKKGKGDSADKTKQYFHTSHNNLDQMGNIYFRNRRQSNRKQSTKIVKASSLSHYNIE